MWVVVACSAGLLSWWLTGRLASVTSSMVGSLDHPNERSLHTQPTPRSGGVAILSGVAIGWAASVAWFAVGSWRNGMQADRVTPAGLWILGAIGLVTVVSYLDDRKGLPIGFRFAVQSVAALMAVWGAGLTLPSVVIPGLATISLGLVSVPATILFLLWITNLYNFMDGMDGFAGGMTVIGFGFLAYFGWRAGHPSMLFVTAAVSASALGFLFHNFPPARIFMGDVGSIPIGFTAGLLMLVGVRDGLFDLWVPVLIFSPFIVDATITVIRRAWHVQRVWQAHREHYYQRLVLSGWSHRKTVLAEYAVMVSCGGLALLYHAAEDAWRLAVLGLWMLLFLVLASAVHARERHVEHADR